MFINKSDYPLISVCRLFITPVEDVSAFTEGTDRFQRSITFKQGKSWKEIYFPPGSALFKEKEKEENAGVLIEQSLKFTFPGEDNDHSSLIAEVSGRGLIVLMNVSQGLPRVFGSPENGAILKRNMEISSKISGSEYEITCLAQDSAWRLQTGAPPP